jgi:hypothetical protein
VSYWFSEYGLGMVKLLPTVSVTWEPAYTSDRMLVDYGVNCFGADGENHPASYTVGVDDNGQCDITVEEILANASPRLVTTTAIKNHLPVFPSVSR